MPLDITPRQCSNCRYFAHPREIHHGAIVVGNCRWMSDNPVAKQLPMPFYLIWYNNRNTTAHQQNCRAWESVPEGGTREAVKI